MPLVMKSVGRDDSREYYVEPKDCLSSHGCAGWALGTVTGGSTTICPICGDIIKPTPMTWGEY